MVVINNPALELYRDLDQEAYSRPILLKGHPHYSRWSDLHLDRGTPVLKMWLRARACPVHCWQRVSRHLSPLDQEVLLRTSPRRHRCPLLLRLERMQLVVTGTTTAIITSITRAMGSVQEGSLLSVLEAIRKHLGNYQFCLRYRHPRAPQTRPTLCPLPHPGPRRVVLLLQHRPHPMFRLPHLSCHRRLPMGPRGLEHQFCHRCSLFRMRIKRRRQDRLPRRIYVDHPRLHRLLRPPMEQCRISTNNTPSSSTWQLHMFILGPPLTTRSTLDLLLLPLLAPRPHPLHPCPQHHPPLLDHPLLQQERRTRREVNHSLLQLQPSQPQRDLRLAMERRRRNLVRT